MTSISDFKKFNIITAKIKDVQEHPNADKLYLVKVDTGSQEKQLVAGIRAHYSKEELVGRTVVIIDNLEPAVIRGEKSEGMLLAASDETTISILSLDKKVKIGSIVK